MDGQQRPPRREEIWDHFVDALDRAGQAGTAGDVLVPDQIGSALSGKRFGDLTRLDLKVLVKIASEMARRGDTILTLWEDMHKRASGKHKLTRKSRGDAASRKRAAE